MPPLKRGSRQGGWVGPATPRLCVRTTKLWYSQLGGLRPRGGGWVASDKPLGNVCCHFGSSGIRFPFWPRHPSIYNGAILCAIFPLLLCGKVKKWAGFSAKQLKVGHKKCKAWCAKAEAGNPKTYPYPWWLGVRPGSGGLFLAVKKNQQEIDPRTMAGRPAGRDKYKFSGSQH